MRGGEEGSGDCEGVPISPHARVGMQQQSAQRRARERRIQRRVRARRRGAKSGDPAAHVEFEQLAKLCVHQAHCAVELLLLRYVHRWQGVLRFGKGAELSSAKDARISAAVRGHAAVVGHRTCRGTAMQR